MVIMMDDFDMLQYEDVYEDDSWFEELAEMGYTEEDVETMYAEMLAEIEAMLFD